VTIHPLKLDRLFISSPSRQNATPFPPGYGAKPSLSRCWSPSASLDGSLLGLLSQSPEGVSVRFLAWGARHEANSIETVPDGEMFGSLTPAEIGGVILEQLCSFTAHDKSNLHLRNFISLFTGQHSSPYPDNHWAIISEAIAEAWAWLIAQGFICPRPRDGEHGWIFVTRLGKQVGTAKEVREFRKALELPKERLHPAIAERCHSHFMRGLFDTAVFEGYKALEIAIREAAEYGPDVYGHVLARRAFGDNGPLRASTAVASEENGLADLMAGALASYKPRARSNRG
jgi:hypothetical protein